jgi:hypothetical protein
VHLGGSRDAARSDRWGAARSLAAARCERWAVVVSRRLAVARRERWGTTVSRRVPGSSHEVAGSAAPMVIPQPTGDARHRHIHPHDPLTYPREKTHAAVRANNLLKKTR